MTPSLNKPDEVFSLHWMLEMTVMPSLYRRISHRDETRFTESPQDDVPDPQGLDLAGLILYTVECIFSGMLRV